MSLTNERVTEITKNTIKDSFFCYFLLRQETSTKHFVISEFFSEESIIRSALGGLETSLGGFWEKLAKQIAKENNFEIFDPKEKLKRPERLPEPINALLSKKKEARQGKIRTLTYL